MVIRRALFAILTVLACAWAIPALAATTLTVTGTMQTPSGIAQRNSFARFELGYCGGNTGQIVSTATLVTFVPFDVNTISTGVFSTPLYGNNEIKCGITTGSSRWRVTRYSNGVAGPSYTYQLTAPGTVNLDGLPACSSTITTNCVSDLRPVVPPPPPIVGPPGPTGPQGPPGAGNGDAGSIQGNLVSAGTATGKGQGYFWNGSHFALRKGGYDNDVTDWACDNTGASSATVCLQSVLDSVSITTGQSINLPSGTYLLGASTTLHLRREMVINGAGGSQNYPATRFKLGPGAQIVVDKTTVSSDGGGGDWTTLRNVQVSGSKMSCTATATSGVLTACSGDPSTVLGLSGNDYIVGMGITSGLWKLWFPQGTKITSTTSTTITLGGGAVSAYSGSVTVMKSGYIVGTGTTANSSTTITSVTNVADWYPGDPIQGAGISYPNFVTGRNVGASTLTLFTAAGSGFGSGNLTKGPLANVAVHAGSVVLEDVSIIDCSGFCYDNNGSVSYTPATIADGNYINRLRVIRSGDALVHFQGADANTATDIGVQGTYGANGCIYDQSFLGNTHIGAQCAGSDGYPYQVSGVGARTTFINCYIEGGQKNPKYGATTIVLNGLGQAYGAGGGNNGNYIIDDGRMSPSFYVKNLQGAASSATCTNASPSLTNVTAIAQWHVGDPINADCLPSSTLVSATDGVSVLTANKNATVNGDLFPITQTATRLLLGGTNVNSILGFGYSTTNSSYFDWALEFDDPSYRAAGVYEPGFFSWRYRNSGKAMSFPTDQSTNSDDQVVGPGTSAPIKFANGIRVGSTTAAPAIKVNASASAPTTGEWQNGSLAISSTNGLWQQRNTGKSTSGLADTTLGSATIANQDANFLARCAPNDRVSGTGIQVATYLVDQNTLSNAATATNAGITVTCKRIAKAHVVTTCDAANTTATLLNCNSISGWAQYDTVQGTGIPTGTFITVAPSGTTITMSQNATATNAGISVTDAVFAKINDSATSAFTEAAAPTGAAGTDTLYGDSTAHRLKMKNNGNTATTVAALEETTLLYNAAGTVQTTAHIVSDASTLISGTPSAKTITLAGGAVFTSNATYNCTVTNKTTPGNGLGIAYTNGTTFVVTGPNTVTDGFSFLCAGN